MQLMSTLDGTIVIVALPRMQADLDLSDAGKSWVITAYVLAFGGLLLLGGRVGDAIGHKRAFLSGVGVFTIASLVCGLASDEYTLIVARARCRASAPRWPPRPGWRSSRPPTPSGTPATRPWRCRRRMQATGSVLGLVLGGLLTVISWRLAFLINVPIGIVIIVIAVLRIGETHHERLKLDVTGALLATLGCTSAVLVFTQGPPRGWVDPWVIGAAVAAVVFFVALPVRRAHRREPVGAVLGVRQPQPGDDVHLAVPRRRGAADGDGDGRPAGAGRARLLGAARRASASCRSRSPSASATCWPPSWPRCSRRAG